MGVPNSEVGYTPAMSRREDYEVHKGYVVALGEEKSILYYIIELTSYCNVKLLL